MSVNAPQLVVNDLLPARILRVVETSNQVRINAPSRPQSIVVRSSDETTLKIVKQGDQVTVVQDVSVALKIADTPAPALQIYDATRLQASSQAGTGGGRRDWIFDIPFAVPSRGELYLFSSGTSLSSAPVVVSTASTLKAISISTNRSDPNNDYAVEVLRNGVVVASLALAANTKKASTFSLGVGFLAGSELSARLVRTSGPVQKSAFRRATITIELNE